MRLDEIVDKAGQKLIKDTLRQLAAEGNENASEFTAGYDQVKITGSDNLVTVRFMLGRHARAAGTMSFAGSGKTQDEINFERKQKRAKVLAKDLMTRLGDFIHIEDYSIEDNPPGYPASVNLFMVSDGFIGNEL